MKSLRLFGSSRLFFGVHGEPICIRFSLQYKFKFVRTCWLGMVFECFCLQSLDANDFLAGRQIFAMVIRGPRFWTTQATNFLGALVTYCVAFVLAFRFAHAFREGAPPVGRNQE